MIETKTHFKMYKAKTKWMVAGVTMFSTMLGAGALANVHADNVSSSSSSQLPITDLNSQSKSYQASLQNYQKQQSQSSAIKSSVEVSSKPSQPVSIAEQSNPQYDKQVQKYQNSRQSVQHSNVNSATVFSMNSTPVKSSVQVSTPKAATPVQSTRVSAQTPAQTNSNTQNVKPVAVMQSTPTAKPQARDAQQQITFGSCNDLNQVVVDLKNSISGDLNSQVQFNNGGGVKSVSENGNQLTITTNNDIDFQKAMTVTVDGQQYTIDPTNGTAMPVVRSQAFDNK